MVANYHFPGSFECSLTYRFIFERQKLTQQGERNRPCGKIAEELRYLFLDGGFVPVISAAIAVAIDQLATCLLFIAAIIRPPVNRVAQHCLFEGFAYLRLPNAGARLEQFMLDCRQGQHRFPIGKRQPWANFENCEVVLHHLL